MTILVRLLLVAVVLTSARAPAAAAPPASSLVRAKEQARRALQLYDLGKYVEAAHLFEEAFQLSDKSDYLYNVAQAYRLAGLSREAIGAYRGFLRRMPTTPLRGEVEATLASLERPVAPPPSVPPPAAPPAPVVTPPAPPPPESAVWPPIFPQGGIAPARTYADGENVSIDVSTSGHEAPEALQAQCERVAIADGWIIDDTAPIRVLIRLLPGSGSHLSILFRGSTVQNVMLKESAIAGLCARAVTGLKQLRATIKQKATEAKSTNEPTHRPTDVELRAAIDRQRALLESCRDVYAKDLAELAFEVSVAATGTPVAVELAGFTAASGLATCVRRVTKNLRFAPFQGNDVVLKTTLTLAPR